MKSLFIHVIAGLIVMSLAHVARGICQEDCFGVSTAFGDDALVELSTGTNNYNTATGNYALLNNTTAKYNTATGVSALVLNTTGASNTATEFQALHDNGSGFGNTAIGSNSHYKNTTGSNNVAIGSSALYGNNIGANNVAIGTSAGSALTGSSDNIAIGSNAAANVTVGGSNIHIGHPGASAERNTIHLGTQGTQLTTYIAGIYGPTLASGTQVRVDSTGKLGTTTSSARFKRKIQPMEKASEAILSGAGDLSLHSGA